MKLVRRLSKHGNSLHVSLPKEVLSVLRWRGGDLICVELTPEFELIVRRTRGSDIVDSNIPSIRLDQPAGPIAR